MTPAPPAVHWAAALALVALACPAAVHDIRSRRIPNRLVLAGLLAGFAINFFLAGAGGLLTALLGAALAMLFYFPLFALRGMGAGDVKLMAALGAIAGPRAWFWIFVAAAVGGAVAGLVLALARGRLRGTLWNACFIVRELVSLRRPYLRREQLDIHHSQALRLPHGVAIAAGVVCVVALSAFR